MRRTPVDDARDNEIRDRYPLCLGLPLPWAGKADFQFGQAGVLYNGNFFPMRQIDVDILPGWNDQRSSSDSDPETKGWDARTLVNSPTPSLTSAVGRHMMMNIKEWYLLATDSPDGYGMDIDNDALTFVTKSVRIEGSKIDALLREANVHKQPRGFFSSKIQSFIFLPRAMLDRLLFNEDILEVEAECASQEDLKAATGIQKADSEATPDLPEGTSADGRSVCEPETPCSTETENSSDSAVFINHYKLKLQQSIDERLKSWLQKDPAKMYDPLDVLLEYIMDPHPWYSPARYFWHPKAAIACDAHLFALFRDDPTILRDPDVIRQELRDVLRPKVVIIDETLGVAAIACADMIDARVLKGT